MPAGFTPQAFCRENSHGSRIERQAHRRHRRQQGHRPRHREGFATEGANVSICARNAGEVAATVVALKANGVKAFGQALDVADGPALAAWVAASAAELGGLDALVCNVSALAIGDTKES